jgi:RNA-binding protein
MITAKQRAKLKSLTHRLNPSVQIGKDGVSENLIKEIDTALFNKELVKIKVMQNSDVKAKELINELAKKLKAEPIMTIGRVIVLYRFSKKEDIEHIKF